MKNAVVSFRSGDLTLYGDLHLPAEGAPCIVALHGLESSKDSGKWPIIAEKLAAEGYACLRFNFRGCGEGPHKSQGSFEETTLTGRIMDFRAALDYLEGSGKVDVRRLGVVGSSMGGMVAIAAGDPRVKAMAVMATPCRGIGLGKPHILGGKTSYYELPSGRRLKAGFYDDLKRYNILEAVRKAPPTLIVHGSHDSIVPIEHAIKLYEAAPEPKRLEIIQGANHVFSNPEHLQRAVSLILKWFSEHL